MKTIEYIKTAVMQIEIEELNGNVIVEAGYDKALLVFRYKKRVVGKQSFNVYNGSVNIKKIKDYLPELSLSIWQAHLESFREINYKNFSVSIVICTYNRAELLENCLSSLQKLDYQNKEIIVIDNSPHIKETFKVVSKFQGVNYYPEHRKGLDIARNTGLRISNGEIVAFIDDDAIADPLWIDNLVKNFSHPLTAVVTGITLPYKLESFPQLYFESTNGFDRGFQKKEFDFTTLNPIGAGRVGAGVNMAIRKHLLKEIGFFDEALDGGTLTRTGGDQEFFYRVIIRGFKIVYEPSALVWHNHRADFLSLKNTLFAYGTGVFAWWTKALFFEKEFKLLLFGPLWFLRYHAANLIKSIFITRKGLFIKLAFAEFIGAVIGPFTYFIALRKVKKTSSHKLRFHEVIQDLKV